MGPLKKYRFHISKRLGNGNPKQAKAIYCRRPRMSIAMGRHVKVPFFILKSKLSASAKLLWIELASLSTKKRPQVMVNPAELAEALGLSERTIRRLISELLKAEFLIHRGYVNRKFKLVEVNLTPSPSPANGKGSKTNSPSPVAGEGSGVRSSELNPQILETWIKRFPALDGGSGRPTLIQCIERAVTDPLLDKKQSLRVWVEQALRLDSRNHIESYMKEKYCLEERVLTTNL